MITITVSVQMMILFWKKAKKKKLIKNPKLYPDEYYVEVMDSMYLPLEIL
jgi:hypothetical protein